MNGRLKIFKVLEMQFWHDLVSHSSCFGAVAVFTQIDFKLHRENFFAAHSFEGYYILVAAADNNRRRGEGGALLVKENDFLQWWVKKQWSRTSFLSS